jgi:hypothetical protein
MLLFAHELGLEADGATVSNHPPVDDRGVRNRDPE